MHEEDSLFARGKLPEINREACEIKVEWQTSFMCGVRIVQLKQSPWSTQQLYAVALCRGAYLIIPEKLFAEEKIEREPDWAFPASGHIDFDVNGTRVVCTAAEKSGCEKGQYDRLVFFNATLDADLTSQPLLMLTPMVNQRAVQGTDGFVLAQAAGGRRDDVNTDIVVGDLNKNLLLFLVADIGDKKVLCRFDIANLQKAADQGQAWPGLFYHQFDAASHIALKYVRGGKLDGVVATRYAMHDMQYIPGDSRQYEKELLNSIPVQAGPVDITVNDELQQLHVLNHLGQSITVLNYELPVYQEQRAVLQQYRADVIAAFYQLLSGLLQYLKDCFCNHLLIQCPECDEDDKVYLGCLSMRNGAVYNICNFTKRKHVKTFMSFSYWLSLIPIGPLVSWAIERLCCLVLPNVFQQQENRMFAISPQQLGTVSAVMNTDHSNMLQAVSLAGKDVTQKGLSELVRAGYKDNSSYQDLVGTEYQYKPGVIKVTQPKFATNQAILQKVDNIELERAKTIDEVQALQNEVVRLRQEKDAAETRFQALEADYNDVLVKRVDAVEADKQQAEQEVTALKTEIAAIKQERSTSEQRFAALEKDIVELNKLRTNVEPIVRAAEPVSSIEGVALENVRILEANNITTVKQLAEADANVLKELGIRHNTATSLIKKANDRLVIKE